MFPLEYPMRIIKKYRKENPIIIDPFCGRGTTIYAARKLGLRSYGFDISPIAVAIARAKLAKTTAESVIELAKGMLEREPQTVPTADFFTHAFSPGTLRQLCSLRDGLLSLDKETDESELLRAAALGCLHGPRAKNPDQSGYCSNQMPRTFASKPEYSVRYWKKKNMTPPEVSVLTVLQRKLGRIKDLDEPTVGNCNRIKCADARHAYPYRHLSGRLLIVTSPPYYGMRTYIEDQWLRNWFLGGPDSIDYGSETQISHSGHNAFAADLARVWSNIRKKGDHIDLYVRFGTIPSVKSDARTLIKCSLEKSSGWRLVSTRRAESASAGKRQAEQMKRGTSAAEEFDFHAVAT